MMKNTQRDDYRTTYQNETYTLGLMVSHYAMIVTVSAVFIMIAWIGYEAILQLTHK